MNFRVDMKNLLKQVCLREEGHYAFLSSLLSSGLAN